jgi:hypothetical protein
MRQMSADDFNKMMYSRGVKREGDMKRLEDQVRQSFKVPLLPPPLLMGPGWQTQSRGSGRL